MFFEALVDLLLTPAQRRPGNINPSGDIGNRRKTSDKTLPAFAKRMGMIALVLAVAPMARDSIAQSAKESIDVPPQYRLLLRAVGSGDQVYGCINGSWVLKAPDARLLNQEGSVIGRHFAGPTWQFNDGSRVKGRAVAKRVAPDADEEAARAEWSGVHAGEELRGIDIVSCSLVWNEGHPLGGRSALGRVRIGAPIRPSSTTCRPARCRSSAICAPDWPAPTTRTAPFGSAPALRYCSECS